MKKKKHALAKHVIESRCTHIVKYTTYPKSGMRSDRKGRCSRWTYRTCGMCRIHCVAQMFKHRCDIHWKALA